MNSLQNYSIFTMIDFNGKTILITGASTGIGKALVQELVSHNCTLFLLARRTELIDSYLKNIENKNAYVYPINCDVSKKVSVELAFEKIMGLTKVIDIAILNAGVGHHVTVETYSSKPAEEAFGTNVFGIIYWVEKLLPQMLSKKKGIIAGVSSLADNRGFSKSGFYCASKAAASIYLEGLRIELEPYGIKVITIKPGFVKTPLTDKNDFDMPLIMPVEKAAKIIIKGIRKKKRIIQFPMITVLGIKLIGMIPGYIYEKLEGKFN